MVKKKKIKMLKWINIYCNEDGSYNDRFWDWIFTTLMVGLGLTIIAAYFTIIDWSSKVNPLHSILWMSPILLIVLYAVGKTLFGTRLAIEE